MTKRRFLSPPISNIAASMTDHSIVTHYKKQLIYRQNDFAGTQTNPQSESNDDRNVKRKRRNRNCRAQFRHEDMELIKLGTGSKFLHQTVIQNSTLTGKPQVALERHKQATNLQIPFNMPVRPIPLRSPLTARRLIPHPMPLYLHPQPYHLQHHQQPVVIPKKREHNDEAIDLSRHKCKCDLKTPQIEPSTIKSKATSVIVAGRRSQPQETKLPFLIDDLLGKDRESGGVIVNPNRRQSIEFDAISICSSSSESVRSPDVDSQIPHGKLFYYKNNNSFIRYFDETQKKLFYDNITDVQDKHLAEDKEIIELPLHATFSGKDNLTVEEYVFEMTQVERYIPRDFFLFYKFVTGYQIYNNNHPVSFLTFLKVYNTNGLKLLLQRYVNSLKKKSI